MPYLVRHLTRFTYTSPVSESVMELRMQPLSDGRQRLLRFDVTTTPRTRVFAYRDFLGNAVHYFDIPGRHTRLDISAEAAVEVTPQDGLPDALDSNAWQGDRGAGRHWRLRRLARAEPLRHGNAGAQVFRRLHRLEARRTASIR